eukprot:747777-Hanusia_phi.AAC.1
MKVGEGEQMDLSQVVDEVACYVLRQADLMLPCCLVPAVPDVLLEPPMAAHMLRECISVDRLRSGKQDYVALMSTALFGCVHFTKQAHRLLCAIGHLAFPTHVLRRSAELHQEREGIGQKVRGRGARSVGPGGVLEISAISQRASEVLLRLHGDEVSLPRVLAGRLIAVPSSFTRTPLLLQSTCIAGRRCRSSTDSTLERLRLEQSTAYNL